MYATVLENEKGRKKSHNWPLKLKALKGHTSSKSITLYGNWEVNNVYMQVTTVREVYHYLASIRWDILER